MAGDSRKYHYIFFVIAGTIGAALCFCGSNPYHRDHAAAFTPMKECLGCHDGFMADAIYACQGSDCLYRKNHSIMRAYPPDRKIEEYAPASRIEDAGCMLEEGRVTCLSCHDLTKPPPHLIREGDQLCRICHIAR
jgi:hypothetical protein